MTVVTGLLGTLCLASAVQGWLLSKMNNVMRIVMLIGALALIKPGWVTDLVGLGIFLAIAGFQWISLGKTRTA